MSTKRRATALGVPRTYWPGQQGKEMRDADFGWVLRAFVLFLTAVALLVGQLVMPPL